MSNTAITVGNAKSFTQYLESATQKLESILPSHITPQAFIANVGLCLMQDPKLLNCTKESLFLCCMEAATLGLRTAKGPLCGAHMIPYTNKKTGITTATLIPNYMGLIDLAQRSGDALSFSAEIIHEKDFYEVNYAPERTMVHKPDLFSDRGERIGCYAMAKLTNGETIFEVMTRAEIEQIRDKSVNYKFAQDKGSTIWGNESTGGSEGEMWKKTALRRLMKKMPKSSEKLARALDLSDADTMLHALVNSREGQERLERGRPMHERIAASLSPSKPAETEAKTVTVTISDDESEAYNLGFKAYGVADLSANPYPEDSRNFNQWQDGWEAACKADVEAGE